MKNYLLILPLAYTLLSTANVWAEDSCSVDNKQCNHAEWRDQATMSDNSAVRKTAIAENVERLLPQERLTLWALPPLPAIGSRPYVADDFRLVKMDLTQQSSQFGSAISKLDAEAIRRVSALVEQLKDKRNVKLHFTGHTDNQPVSVRARHWIKDNKTLSIARAKAVADYFRQALNLPAKSVTYDGMGDRQPLASNSTPAGMAKNRRVEMDVWFQPDTVKRTVVSNTMNRRQVCKGEIQSGAKKSGGFRISIDGQPVDGSVKDGENAQRCTDVALSKANIRLQYDNQSAKPMLDVSAWPATATIGETINFQGYSNYRKSRGQPA